jgi:hypothetical protein
MPADVYGSPDGKFMFIGLTGGDGVEVFSITGARPRRPSAWADPHGKGAHAFARWATAATCW